jgi:metal-dependent amidase/aminoacylase/carboxypeptidase family protein
MSDPVQSAKAAAIDVAKFVYEHPELGSEELESSKFIIGVLKRNGFDQTRRGAGHQSLPVTMETSPRSFPAPIFR